MSAYQITFLYNKSNVFGISQDVKLLEKAFRKAGFGKIRHADPLEPPVLSDLNVHFEIPIYGSYPWARMNMIVVNPEWWEDAWNPYLVKTDSLIFKCKEDHDKFMSKRGGYLPGHVNVIVLPWTSPLTPTDFEKFPKSNDAKNGCLWLLGASKNKRAAAEYILPLWNPSWPSLTVYTTIPLTYKEDKENVKVIIQDVPEETRRTLQSFYPCHLIFSQAESLGLAAHEAQAAGAYILGNELPSYSEAFREAVLKGCCAFTSSSLVEEKAGVKDIFTSLTSLQLESLINGLTSIDFSEVRKKQKEMFIKRQEYFFTQATPFLKSLFSSEHFAEQKKHLRTLPPILNDNELPNISVITLLHNRRKFVDLALHNLLITDYPKSKIEWVVVEDSDKVEEQASDKIMKFGREAAPMSVSYIPLPKVVSIGEKRNIGIERAQHDIILMMDDDDHYPPTSFRRRVCWLLKHPWAPEVCATTTLACYDLIKGTSAVNTPPWELGASQRISEATLTFHKRFWKTKPFPTVNIAEGEGFLEGREHCLLELQPQQIIVAMSHTQNASSRRIPPGPSGKPSCFWGFPKEFLIFLHRLAGVEIEEEKEKKLVRKNK